MWEMWYNFIQTHTMENGFIITQYPPSEKAVDFLRLLIDHECSTIICLDPLHIIDSVGVTLWHFSLDELALLSSNTICITYIFYFSSYFCLFVSNFFANINAIDLKASIFFSIEMAFLFLFWYIRKWHRKENFELIEAF